LFITTIYPESACLATLGFGRKDLDKAGKGAVVSLFYVRREDTGGKLVELKVVGNAVAALAFSGTGLVGAGAFGFVDFNLTFH
jgi:hypothetical protein